MGLNDKIPFCVSNQNGVFLELYIQPGASSNEVVGLHGNRLKIKLTSRPIGGSANRALIEFLAGCLGFKKKALHLVSGIKSREKRVKIEGVPIALLSIKIEAVYKKIKGAV